jgi:hypothetical protein
MNGTYEERLRTCTWDLDQTGRLTIAAAYNYFKKVASNHAGATAVVTSLPMNKDLDSMTESALAIPGTDGLEPVA